MVSHNKLQRLQEFPSLLIRAKNFESLKHIAWVNNIPLIRILAYNWAVSYKSPLLFSTQFGFFPPSLAFFLVDGIRLDFDTGFTEIQVWPFPDLPLLL